METADLLPGSAGGSSRSSIRRERESAIHVASRKLSMRMMMTVFVWVVMGAGQAVVLADFAETARTTYEKVCDPLSLLDEFLNTCML
jgi:hypothetical protein